jgi:hypothetical protein
MNTEPAPLPPLALALGRLQQPRPNPPRAWPFAPAPAALRQAAPPATTNDFLVITAANILLNADTTLATEPAVRVPGVEAARTYWFDL